MRSFLKLAMLALGALPLAGCMSSEYDLFNDEGVGGATLPFLQQAGAENMLCIDQPQEGEAEEHQLLLVTMNHNGMDQVLMFEDLDLEFPLLLTFHHIMGDMYVGVIALPEEEAGQGLIIARATKNSFEFGFLDNGPSPEQEALLQAHNVTMDSFGALLGTEADQRTFLLEMIPSLQEIAAPVTCVPAPVDPAPLLELLR